MYEKVVGILSDFAGIAPEEITPETSLAADLDLNSLDVVNLAVSFEDEFGLEIPDSDIKTLQIVRDIVTYLENHI